MSDTFQRYKCEGGNCVYMQLAAEAQGVLRFTGQRLVDKEQACEATKRNHEGRVPCGLAAARVCVVAYQDAERLENEAVRASFGPR